MGDKDSVRQIYGNPAVFRICKTDKRFPYVVALARAVNALYSAHSLMQSSMGLNTPMAMRDRMNAHFFISGILYETLKLIRGMSSIFSGDPSFESTLRVIMRDTSGQLLEKMHLKSARHGGVFHFLPDKFADAITKTGMPDCIFASILGTKRGNIHYPFADYITAEMMVGGRLDDNTVVPEMMDKTLKLVKQIIELSEDFIGDQLNNWGFELRPDPRGTAKV